MKLFYRRHRSTYLFTENQRKKGRRVGYMEEGPTLLFQLGPQQLKYMTVRSDSSACFNFSVLGVFTEESRALENRLTFAEEVVESLRDLKVESYLVAWSLIPCIARDPAW
uniref:Uncharacterized protein n=1 Tax=Nelumbo nucifera TaxID=4432 RepID=A0A822XNX3_NELNU|nr:TPA_asm: hypothetical protein HUJ06_022222 [Nelumbo nucifera]DAD20761.1 TPA_asm: hypothetical protein HUJ06_022224 [Nelumbo nucifera]